ncbi:helix-turn-helix domain-containing protein [Haladaptatus sp. DJG-WS-42]|uniref:helix-turn-helix transcriptional regulator n=1 Tax=Haladaptatus sp. DJG-WS-42 TaxID=3120516 RepID=UPI0030D3EC25
MGPPEPREAMTTVEKRRGIVSCLRAEPHDTRDLVDALGASRSTVYRGTRELEALRLIEQVDGSYALTTFGRAVAESYFSFSDDLETLCDLQPSLSALPREVDIPTHVLAGAAVVHATAHDPDRPVTAFERVVRNADRLIGFSPIPRSRYIDLFSDELLAGTLDADLVTTSEVVEYMLSEYDALLTDVFAVENFRFFATTDPLLLELMVVEAPREFLTVSLYDEQKHMRAFLTNDDSAAVSWGRAQFERYRENATLVNA